jgi:hypothetical protein
MEEEFTGGKKSNREKRRDVREGIRVLREEGRNVWKERGGVNEDRRDVGYE